jgi:hypothetical protein
VGLQSIQIFSNVFRCCCPTQKCLSSPSRRTERLTRKGGLRKAKGRSRRCAAFLRKVAVAPKVHITAADLNRRETPKSGRSSDFHTAWQRTTSTFRQFVAAALRRMEIWWSTRANDCVLQNLHQCRAAFSGRAWQCRYCPFGGFTPGSADPSIFEPSKASSLTIYRVNEGSTLTCPLPFLPSAKAAASPAAAIQSFATTLLQLAIKVVDSNRRTCFDELVGRG